MMNTPENTENTENTENMETAGLGQCHACDAERLGRDRFCRRCGASQRLKITSVTGATELSARDTRPLLGIRRYDSFSGALVNLVTESVSTQTSSPAGNRWAMRLAGALVAVPLWLMIVLLSPLDAYVAARAIARRV
jgi:hypothetical protein